MQFSRLPHAARIARILVPALLLGALALPAAAQDDAATLWTQATLYRDEWGTPHVYAQNPRALGFAFGYAQAEDHIEAMLMAYRIANGRAAEVAGEKMAASDEFNIHMGHARIAAQALATCEPAVVELCTGFAMGANTWLAEHQDTAPAWADGVKPSDPLALWRAFIVSMAPLDLPGFKRPNSAMITGNAWALAPERSEDGKAMLVINPHNYFDGPFRWYEAHLALGGMDIAGATLFGLPLIVQGYNAHLGWAFTPNFPDFADVFVEEPAKPEINPKEIYDQVNAERMKQQPMLEYLSHAQPYFVRTDEGMKERAAPAMLGARGPIFASGNTFYSWTIGGFGDSGAFSQLLAMASAPDLESFQAALAQRQIPCFNVTYADQQGNILYLYNAKAGTRAVAEPEARRDGATAAQQGIHWAQPVNGAYYPEAWGEAIALDALPSVVNPATGFLQACGGPPWACTDDAPLDPTAYPAYFINETDTFRARRVRQLLRSGTRSLADMQAMLYDVVVPAASEMAPVLLEMADAAKGRVTVSHPDLETGLNLLRDWNYNADTGAKAMTFYHVWWNLLTAKHASEFLNEAAMYDALAAKTPAAQDAALGAAADAARLLRNDLNALEIPWGDVHRILRGNKDYPIDGADTGEPIFLASGFEYGGGKWRASYGYGVAMAVAFGDEPEAVSVSTFGASENPSSPHYADQLELLLAHRFKRARFAERDVVRHAASGYGREVTLYPLGAAGQVTFICPAPARCALDSAADPPAPLPDGLAAFTVFVRPRILPAEIPAELGVSLAVPAEVCADDNVDALTLYAYTDAGGWVAVAQPSRDDSHRILSGSPTALGVYAVLGPAAALIQPDATPAPAPTPAPEAKVDAPADAAQAPQPEETPKGEVHVGRTRSGTTNLKLKGAYESEVARKPQAPTDIAASERGVRVLHLRGDELGGGLPTSSGTPKGRALWMEGLPKDFKIDEVTAPTDNTPATAPGTPLIAPAIKSDGPKVLRMKGSDRSVEAVPEANAPVAPAPEPTTPLPSTLAPAPAGPSLEGSALPHAPMPAPQAAPADTVQEPQPDADPDKKLSRKEKKRLKQQQEEAQEKAAQQVQSLDFTQQGVQIQHQDGSAPPDSFGDAPDNSKKSKKKRH